MVCPCQSGQLYEHCCGQYLSHLVQPENALQLMRSRYSAYVLGDRDYLVNTWHARFRPSELSMEEEFVWIGLEVLDYEQKDKEAKVEFEARLIAANKVSAVHERSSFVLEREQWLYTSGEILVPSFQPWKPGRNENCPCGSGKKFKRCCARAY